jgi:hypothetical protein
MKTEELRSLLLGIISDYPEKACWTVSMAHLKILVDKAVKTEREACAKMVEPLDESLADEIRARGEE